MKSRTIFTRSARTHKVAAVAMTAIAAVGIAGCSVNSGTSSGGGSNKDAAFPSGSIQLDQARQKAFDVMKGKRIAFVPILYKGYPLTENWGTTMSRTFENMGAQFQVYDSNFSSDRMVSTINDLIARKAADVLVLQNQDLGLLDSAIEAAQKAGIYTVVLNMMSTRLGDAFIGADVYGSAKAIARRAADNCSQRNGPKSFAIIDGPGNDPASALWDKGIKEVLEPLGYQVTVAHSQFQNAVAQQAAESIIQQQQGNVCGFLVLFDTNAITVGQTVASAVSRGQAKADAIGTYTFDLDSNACDAMRKGLITASSAYDVQGIGASAASSVQQLLQSGNPAGSTHSVAYVSNTLVDKSNVDQTSIACYTAQ